MNPTISTVAPQPVSVVPPGAPGNATGAGIPLFGPQVELRGSYCFRVYTKAESDALDESRSRRDNGEQELRAITDAGERLIRGAAYYLEVSDADEYAEGGRRIRVPSADSSRGVLRLAMLDRTATSGTWDTSSIASWFARTAAELGVQPDRRSGPPSRRSLFSRSKPVVETAWLVPRVLLKPHTVMNGPDAAITQDGNIALDGAQLSLAALVYLAAKLRIPVQWRSDVVRIVVP